MASQATAAGSSATVGTSADFLFSDAPDNAKGVLFSIKSGPGFSLCLDGAAPVVGTSGIDFNAGSQPFPFELSYPGSNLKLMKAIALSATVVWKEWVL